MSKIDYGCEKILLPLTSGSSTISGSEDILKTILDEKLQLSWNDQKERSVLSVDIKLTSIRYWLEDMISAGVRVVCFAVANPGKDIFLDMIC